MGYIRNEHFPLREETELIINLSFEVYNELGFGFSEIVYKEALELEFKTNEMLFEREKEYPVVYKGAFLPHRFFADFIIFDAVILEVKTKNAITYDDILQAINYLKCSDCEVALIINFGRSKVELKRLVL